jgi:hypothetical protein
LIREWHGTQHQVTALKDGFLYRAKRFRSLSEIARQEREAHFTSARGVEMAGA